MEKCTPSLVNNVRESFINTHSIYNRNNGSSFMIVFLIFIIQMMKLLVLECRTGSFSLDPLRHNIGN